ncbi:MAG: Conserved exported or envelope protein of unknown function [Solirubrobacterales bacterium]|nr:Conserved exported or envelope protein of unknown function [Solirubrobacterales bacterium]
MGHKSTYLRVLAVALVAMVAGGGGAAAQAQGSTVDDACATLSPTALTCTAAAKVAGAVNAECRRLGVPAALCTVPIGPQVAAGATEAYLQSWTHRAAQFQVGLGDQLPLRQAQWLGTHNSFNSASNDPPTVSSLDSNQQLSLGQQLDIDMRSLELDLHDSGPGGAVLVCHGRGPSELHLGCTSERPLTAVLPEIAGWLNEPSHRHDVILLYLENELGTDAGFAQTVQQLDAGLKRADGSSLLYRPSPAQVQAATCAPMPLATTRDEIRATGAQVILVGNCRAGWKADVFGWDDTHVESGSTADYKPFPACDAVYPRSVYDAKLVRYFEDSTLVSTVVDPTQSPALQRQRSLTPATVGAMTRCGVGLLGMDQILPNDGRIDASIWSWAQDKPNAADGPCAVQRADSRWATRPCAEQLPAACRVGAGWAVTPASVTAAGASDACAAMGGTAALPRTGYENELLHQAAGGTEVWLAYRTSAKRAAHRPARHRQRARARPSSGRQDVTHGPWTRR